MDETFGTSSTKEGEDKDQVIGIINYWDSVSHQIINNGQGYCHCNLSPFSDQVLMEQGAVLDGLKKGEWEGLGGVGESQFTFKESYEKGTLVQGIQHWGGNKYTYSYLKRQAMPVGGIKTFYANIAEDLRYPVSARKKNIQGVVYVEFVIDEAGYLNDIRIVKGIEKGCDEEAMRAVTISPKWSPGFVRGRPVKRRMTLPIIFKLRV